MFQSNRGVLAMADYPNLEANLEALHNGNAIPSTDAGRIGDHVKQAINDLTSDQIQMLINLANKAGVHLFMHDKENHIIAMGL